MIKHYINGQWISSESKMSVDIPNPATGELIEKCPLGTENELNQAVAAAKAAFKGWRETPTVDRVQYFFKLKALMEESFEELAALVTKEHGKTLVESRGSVRRGIQMVETACGMPTMLMGEHFEDIAPGIDCKAVNRPLGVFGVIAPFNFPAMVPFWFWPFGVAAGNTMVIKPSERVPLTQVKVFELIEKAGFPKGVVNMVHGGKDVVNAMCVHPDVKGVSFVGSTPVAKHVYVTTTSHGKRVQALGGAKNFMVVLPDAVMDKAAATAFESIIGCAGERCLAGSVVISIGKETASALEDLMVRRAKETTIGNGMDKNVQMGPLISQAAKDRVKDLIQSAIDEGAKLLVDGREGVDQMQGYFLKPTVLSGIKAHMRIAKEEVFGPVVLLAEKNTFDEAIQWINDSPYGNTTTLFTQSGAAARKFSYDVEPSMIGINIGVPAPMAFFSFGGTKDSFFGDVKAHGKACIGFYTDTKVTVERWMSDANVWAQK
ncbi:MAG: CoA-acylating methylmalonate-semialdehyde dehydrogenase [Bdellovibrionales bacterium]|nr:CoA-acylating methylmalonate-semialdehyde dehydrogenase [Oligoflexia bacterium]